jgi:hypothetical protein
MFAAGASVELVSKARAEVRGGSGVGPGVGPEVGPGVGPGVQGIPEIGGHKNSLALCSADCALPRVKNASAWNI